MTRQETVTRALKALGVTGKIEVRDESSRAIVYVDGQYFGIYDFEKNTFVD